MDIWLDDRWSVGIKCRQRISTGEYVDKTKHGIFLDKIFKWLDVHCSALFPIIECISSGLCCFTKFIVHTYYWASRHCLRPLYFCSLLIFQFMSCILIVYVLSCWTCEKLCNLVLNGVGSISRVIYSRRRNMSRHRNVRSLNYEEGKAVIALHYVTSVVDVTSRARIFCGSD